MTTHQRELHTIFSEMRAILDVFPSWDWTPDDAKAVLDTLSRRFFLHKSQADVGEADLMAHHDQAVTR